MKSFIGYLLVVFVVAGDFFQLINCTKYEIRNMEKHHLNVITYNGRSYVTISKMPFLYTNFAQFGHDSSNKDCTDLKISGDIYPKTYFLAEIVNQEANSITLIWNIIPLRSGNIGAIKLCSMSQFIYISNDEKCGNIFIPNSSATLDRFNNEITFCFTSPTKQCHLEFDRSVKYEQCPINDQENKINALKFIIMQYETETELIPFIKRHENSVNLTNNIICKLDDAKLAEINRYSYKIREDFNNIDPVPVAINTQQHDMMISNAAKFSKDNYFFNVADKSTIYNYEYRAIDNVCLNNFLNNIYDSDQQQSTDHGIYFLLISILLPFITIIYSTIRETCDSDCNQNDPIVANIDMNPGSAVEVLRNRIRYDRYQRQRQHQHHRHRHRRRQYQLQVQHWHTL